MGRFIKKSAIDGFTLIELTIVITIIGLIIAGVAAGKSLIAQAKLSSVIKESSSYLTAIRTFKTKYNFLPGDTPNATAFWPSASTANGNGNGVVDSATLLTSPLEDTYAWNHLSIAGIISGTFSGGVGSVRYTIGTNAPASSYGGGTAYQIYNTSYFGNASNNLIMLGSMDATNGYLDNGAMLPSDASSIDNKIDDGQPNTGLVAASRGLSIDGTAGLCVNSSVGVTVSSVSYVLTDNTASCRLYFPF